MVGLDLSIDRPVALGRCVVLYEDGDAVPDGAVALGQGLALDTAR